MEQATAWQMRGQGVGRVRACTVSRWSGTHSAMTLDFRFSAEVEAFRDEVRTFLRHEMAPEKVTPHGDDGDLTGLGEQFERQLLQRAGERGFLGISLPVEWGGGGRPASFQAAFNLEVAAHDAPLIDTAVTLAAQPLVAWGSPEQRAFFLPRIIAGELIACIAYTEPDAGSDLGNLSMTAEPDGDGFVLTGVKALVTAAHKADWVDPIGLTYRGTTLHEIPPSGQGIAACMALGILENFDVAGHDADGPEVAHLRIEAMKLAFADIWRYVADPRFMEVTPAQMLDKHYLKSRARLIDPRKAKDFGPGTPKDGGTIYLGTADASGMMVSLIQSNYTGFGSGIVVPGTGIALQNRATGFVTTAGHANQVGPKKRPFHTIIPAFITKDDKPVATFGLMGGAMQPQGHMQVFSRIVDYGQNPQAAIDGPRWRVHETDGTVWTEEHMPAATIDGLEARGHKVTRTKWPSFDFGSSQIIWRFPDGGPYLAASESRRDGAAVGF